MRQTSQVPSNAKNTAAESKAVRCEKTAAWKQWAALLIICSVAIGSTVNHTWISEGDRSCALWKMPRPSTRTYSNTRCFTQADFQVQNGWLWFEGKQRTNNNKYMGIHIFLCFTYSHQQHHQPSLHPPSPAWAALLLLRWEHAARRENNNGRFA